MASGSLLAVIAILALATAPNFLPLLAGWLLAGAATFYPPAFAAVTRWWGPDRVRTVVTLAAGLASTVSAPITAALAEHLSWRTTYLTLAALPGIGFAVLPVLRQVVALRPEWARASVRPAQGSGSGRATDGPRPCPGSGQART
ncbi:MFS transporter [Streptomyces sp. NPDC050485]|uniref:MFS transporter n=1 Tax=Streptomyces sp. NPDC050485 TaxID=3365617 RepID=UPI0037A2DA1B